MGRDSTDCSTRIATFVQDGEVGGRQPLVRVNLEKKRVSVTHAEGDGPPKTTETAFDCVYDENCKQEELYEELGVPLVSRYRAFVSP